jgi:hypothetical protein
MRLLKGCWCKVFHTKRRLWNLCNGSTTVLALRQMQYENALTPLAVMDAANLNSHDWMRLRLLARHMGETY